MTRCSICNSEHIAAIDSLLDAGTNQKDVAAQFGVSRFALSRHVRHSKPAPAAAPENGDAESLEVQAEKWLQRADDIYAQSTANGDVRGQVQALGAAFRGLELQARSESRSGAPKTPGDGTPITIELMDEIIQRAMGDRRSKLIDRICAAPDATLADVENLLSTGVN